MSTGEITNEEIASIAGWERAEWIARDGGPLVAGWVRLDCEPILHPPDYLGGDELREAERICKERGWSVELQADAWAVEDPAETYWVATLWPHEVQWNTKDRDELTLADACEETLARAWFTAILAADRATRAEHEEE